MATIRKLALVEGLVKNIYDSGYRKPVTVPRHTFVISDDEGNESKFFVRKRDRRVTLSRRDVITVVNAYVDFVADAIRRGDSVALQEFGTIKPHYRAARRSFAPKGGYQGGFSTTDMQELPAHYLPKFDASARLRRAARLYGNDIKNVRQYELEENNNDADDIIDDESLDLVDFPEDDQDDEGVGAEVTFNDEG